MRGKPGFLGFVEMLISIKLFDSFLWQEGLHPSLAHPVTGWSAGRVDWDSVIFLKELRTVPIALWGRHSGQGISPRSVTLRGAGKVE